MKKTTVKTTVIGGVIIDSRIKWSAESQEFEVNVKRSRDRKYDGDLAYFTGDYVDARNTAENMLVRFRESIGSLID